MRPTSIAATDVVSGGVIGGALQVLREVVETVLPYRPVLLEPGLHLSKRPALESAQAALSVPRPGDEPGRLEHAHVLGDGAHGQLERLGELRHGRLAMTQPVEDRPAGRIG